MDLTENVTSEVHHSKDVSSAIFFEAVIQPLWHRYHFSVQRLRTNSFERSVYSQGQTTECVEHMITVWWEEGGGSSEVAERQLKDPELRQWHLPATRILLHQLHGEKAKKRRVKKTKLQGQSTVCIILHNSVDFKCFDCD